MQREYDTAVANAVRAMTVARRRGLKLFYTEPERRADEGDFPLRLSDRGRPGEWPDPKVSHAETPGSYANT